MRVLLTALLFALPLFGQPPKAGIEETSDRAGRGESDGAFERGVKPTLDRTEPVEKLRMAEELGLPWIAWVQYDPSRSKEAGMMFEELAEAKHVYIETDYVIGRGMGPRVVFRGKDGEFRWMKADNCVHANAAKVRQAWMGEVAPGSMKYAEQRTVAVATSYSQPAMTMMPAPTYVGSPTFYQPMQMGPMMPMQRYVPPASRSGGFFGLRLTGPRGGGIMAGACVGGA